VRNVPSTHFISQTIARIGIILVPDAPADPDANDDVLIIPGFIDS